MTEEEVKEILKGEFTLDIPNFEKWNPPIKDKKTGELHENQFRSYIKLSVHTFDDPRFHGLTKEECFEWLKLCLRRASNGPITCQQGANALPTMCQRRANRVPTLLVKLLKRQLIVLSKERKKERKKGEPPTAPDGASKNQPKFDIESLYELFPKRPGIERFQAGINKLRKIIKTQEQFDAVKVGVLNYAKARQGEDAQFTLGFSKWVEAKGWEQAVKPEKKQFQIVDGGIAP